MRAGDFDGDGIDEIAVLPVRGQAKDLIFLDVPDLTPRKERTTRCLRVQRLKSSEKVRQNDRRKHEMKGLLPFLLLFSTVTFCSGQTQPDYDRCGGAMSIAGTKTGWFHIEKIGGRWHFVTPEGHAFFSLGATHAVECMRQDELNLFATKYAGSEQRLAEFFLARFKEWGYNSSGYGPLPTMEKRLPYVATMWTEGPRSFSAGEKIRCCGNSGASGSRASAEVGCRSSTVVAQRVCRRPVSMRGNGSCGC